MKYNEDLNLRKAIDLDYDGNLYKEFGLKHNSRVIEGFMHNMQCNEKNKSRYTGPRVTFVV